MRVVYVSYDGALDPLGASQVVPYLLGLAAHGLSVSLISFEKQGASSGWTSRDALVQRLAAVGIGWRPLTYHSRPRLPATLWDCAAGAQAIRAEIEASGVDVVHCRGDVAMTMARWARPPGRTALLYDVRGFFAEERVEVGSWRRGSVLDRLVRAAERENLRQASGVVVLTEAARDILRSRHEKLPPLRIVPTCADLSRFSPPRGGDPRDFGLVYCGSLGTWYMTREMVEFARAASATVTGRVLFLTPQPDVALAAGAASSWADARAVSPEEVPAWLRRARASFFFIQPTPAKRASCPTKLAEGLATGLPVVANAGIGDLDQILEPEGVGVLVREFSAEAYGAAAARLGQLLENPETPARCRRLAERRYGVETGVKSYLDLYREITERGDPSA